MDEKNRDSVCENAIAEIGRRVAEFKSKLDSRTSDPKNFITLTEIEQLWSILNKATMKTYSDMISAYLSQLDEKAVIQLKKVNTGRTESG